MNNKEAQKYEKGALDSRFSIFSPMTVDMGTNKENRVRYFPLVKPSDGQVVEFVIPPSNFQYTNFSKCTLQMKVALKKNNGDAVKETDLVAFVNMPIAALYRQCDVYLNQVLMTGDVNIHYGYKAVMDTLLTKSDQYLKTIGTTFMFNYDTSGKMDETGLGKDGVNTGLVARWNRTKKGESVLLETPLHIDLCKMKQYLMSGVEIRIVLHPANQKIAIMSSEDTSFWKASCTDHQLIWDHVEPTTGVLYHHNELLASNPALYSLPKSSIKSYSIVKGLKDWSLDSLYTDLPHCMHIAMVKSAAFTGDYGKNPWAFYHFDLESLTFHIENDQTIMLRPDFDNDEYTSEYIETLRRNSDQSVIEYGHFKDGYSIFTINISSGVRRAHNLAAGPASTRLSVRFSEDLPENITLIVYSRTESQFRVDRAKNVFLI